MKTLNRKFLNKAGFSLIELMVVVAIMAILATVAAPSYHSFRARARQKQGFALLSTYYTSAQATRVEFGHYPGNFVQTGFQPTGTLGYRLRARDGNDIGLGWNDDICFRTQAACDCGLVCPDFKTWEEAPTGNVNRLGITSITPFAGVCGTLPAIGVTDTAFSIRVGGWIRTGAGAVPDAYGMDHNKNLVMCQDGLN